MNIQLDKVFEESYVIKNENSAENMGSGDLAVLSTPSLVAFMENAAKNYLNKFYKKSLKSFLRLFILVSHTFYC